MSVNKTFVLAAVVVAVAACADGPSDPPPIVYPVAKTIELDKTSVELFEDDTLRLHATVKDSTGTVISNPVLVWESGDPSRRSVSNTGLVTALAGDGLSVKITATYQPPGVTRLSASALVKAAPLAGFDVYPMENGLIPGMQRGLGARLVKVYAGLAPGPVVTEVAGRSSWTSSDASVATVDATGKVTAVAQGHALVTATYTLASGKTKTSTADVWVDAGPSAPLHFVSVSGGQAQVRRNNLFGSDHRPRACGLTDAGDVYCWGAAQAWMSGHLDWCTGATRLSPAIYGFFSWRCTEVPQKLPSEVKFKSLAARGDQSCAIDVSGRVWCWGWNRGGELGTGTADTLEHLPTRIASEDSFVQLASGIAASEITTSQSICALRTDAVAVCWQNAFGLVPKAMTGTTWRSLADAAPCGVTADSTAYCMPSGSPQTSWAGRKWAQVGGVTCALDPSGTVYCGPNAYPVGAPIVSLNTYNASITGTFQATPCGLTAGGDMYCFDQGALRLTNPGGTRLKQNFGHCGIALDDKAYCWIANPDGTVAFRRIPGQ